MIKNQINLIYLYGFLILLAIHSGGQILTSFLNTFVVALIPFEQLPYFRLIILMAEIIIAVYIIRRISNEKSTELKSKQIVTVLIISLTLFVVSFYRKHLDNSFDFSGLSRINDVEAGRKAIDIHSRNVSIVSFIELITITITVLIVTLANLNYEKKASDDGNRSQQG